MCLTGTDVASWSITQELAGSSPFNDKYFCHWIQRIQGKHLGKTPLFAHYKLKGFACVVTIPVSNNNGKV